MKFIGSVKETLSTEKRISITPDTVKKFVELGFSIILEKNFSNHLGISDEEYISKGAKIFDTAKEVMEKSDIILKVNLPSSDQINFIKSNSLLIGQFEISTNKEIVNKILKREIKIFKGNVIVLGRKSQNSLYNNSLVSFDEKGDYDQKDAEGFIKINSIRLKNLK